MVEGSGYADMYKSSDVLDIPRLAICATIMKKWQNDSQVREESELGNLFEIC